MYTTYIVRCDIYLLNLRFESTSHAEQAFLFSNNTGAKPTALPWFELKPESAKRSRLEISSLFQIPLIRVTDDPQKSKLCSKQEKRHI